MASFGSGRFTYRMRASASSRVAEVTTVQWPGGIAASNSAAPSMARTPSRSSISRRSTFRFSLGASRVGATRRMVSMERRPWAHRTTKSGSSPCSFAQPRQTRSTAGVESTRTPSRSNSTALQVSISTEYQKLFQRRLFAFDCHSEPPVLGSEESLRTAIPLTNYEGFADKVCRQNLQKWSGILDEIDWIEIKGIPHATNG